MSSPTIRIERADGVATITMHRPEVRNALNLELASSAVAAIEECQNASAIVLTGSDPAFCAGLDLRDLGVDNLRDLPSVTAALASSAVPVIGAVNGPAVTGGLEIALSCDFLVASERATFADTHLRVGVFPGPAFLQLPARVGWAWARELSFTGNFVDATTALRIGLVNHVVPHQDVVTEARRLAHDVADVDNTLLGILRDGWRALAESPPDVAGAVHKRFRTAARGPDRTPSDITSRREDVLARARRQRGEGAVSSEVRRAGPAPTPGASPTS